ncbi:profilin [Streptosporangium sp. NPDC002524]|uniref:profilin n=1 Tax=Streptosporangium sp. NPDC002524 TaxID=3154537 RepID=UPI003317CE26
MDTGWQTYVDDSLIGSGHIDQAGIYSLTDEVFYALSPGFDPTPEEMRVIVGIVTGDEAVKDRAFGDGLHVAGNRYILTKAEDRSIYARSGRTGITVAKANRTVIVGHHPETAVAGNANSTVESLADYLTGQGY